MGRSIKVRPARLAEKLLQIRLRLNLTQTELFERLNYRFSPLFIGHISDIELGKRVPSIPMLLCYARLAGISLESIVDDEMELPVRLANEPDQVPTERIINEGQCPYCGDQQHLMKKGRNRSGSRRLQCAKCFRYYTPEPAQEKHPRMVRAPYEHHYEKRETAATD